MFCKYIDKVGEFTVGKKYFTFPVNDIFLKINGYRFRGTKVLHGIRDLDPEFFANTEEVVNGCPAVENNRRIFQDVDPAGSEFFG